MERTSSASACLRRAVDTLRDDPIGLLLPAGGALLLDVLLLLLAQSLWPQDLAALGQILPLLLGAWLVRSLLQTLLRSRMLAVGARAAGLPAASWGRPVALLGVELVVAPLVALAALLGGLPLAALAVTAASHGWFTTGAALLTLGLALALGLSAVVRAIFALAPAEVVVGGRSALHALRSSARLGPAGAVTLPGGLAELGGRLLLVAAGDLAVSVGGLSCGAGWLPGYPITDMAMLHRWRGPERGSR